MKQVLYIIIAIIIVSLLSYGGWRLDRWANWKFGYSDKVENRLVDLEARIELLERS